MGEDVRLKVNGAAIGGWTSVSVTRRCEGMPSSFELGLTDIDPATGIQTVARAGDPCEIYFGADKVLTGYIDRDINSGDATGHNLQIIGRGKCADLVDCCAEWKGGQITGSNALEVAQKLASAYGIKVYALAGTKLGEAIPQFDLNFGDTAYEIIEHLTRAAGLLAYEDPNGDAVMAQVGSVKAASGFAYGQNVQAWSVNNAMDQRFSDVCCELLSLDAFSDIGEGGMTYYTAKDPNVARHRLMYLVMEQISGGMLLCATKAIWEVARRAGRGAMVHVVSDSWRDSAKTLWTPNTLAPVDVPGMRVADKVLCISEVTYRFDENGTTAEVSLMPKEGFTPEPIVLNPVNMSDVEPVAPSGSSK